MILFSGLIGFPITPMTASAEILEPDLRRLVGRIEAGGADASGLLGSTGAYMFLSREQRRRAVAVAVGAVAETPVIVGIGALRTDEAQALACDAAAEGASGLLLAPVSYNPLTEDEVFHHFLAVASASDLPLCIYSNPATTQFTFRPDLVARLATIPSVAAIKLPLPASGHLASDLAAFRAAAPGLLIGYSGDWGCTDALLSGADGWYSVVAGLFPGRAAALTAAARRGDRVEAERHAEAFETLWALCRTHGSIRLMYAAAALLGLTQSAPPAPLLGPAPALIDQLREALPRDLDG